MIATFRRWPGSVDWGEGQAVTEGWHTKAIARKRSGQAGDHSVCGRPTSLGAPAVRSQSRQRLSGNRRNSAERTSERIHTGQRVP